MDETVAPESVESQPQPVVESPPPEQATPTTAPEAGTPTTDKGMLAAFTQSQQKLSAVAAALGIPKTSNADQFVAAITARRQAIVEEDDELAKDPRLAPRLAAIRAHEERLVQQQYPEAAPVALALMDAVKGTGSIADLAEIVNTALYEAAARVNGATPAQAGGTQPSPAQPQQPEAPPPERRFLGESDFRGNAGMFDPGITREQAKSPEGFFRALQQRIGRPL